MWWFLALLALFAACAPKQMTFEEKMALDDLILKTGQYPDCYPGLGCGFNHTPRQAPTYVFIPDRHGDGGTVLPLGGR